MTFTVVKPQIALHSSVHVKIDASSDLAMAMCWLWCRCPIAYSEVLAPRELIFDSG